MKFSKILMSSAVVVAAFSGTQVNADPAPTSELTYSGVVDFSYDWSPNDAIGADGWRQFETETDAFSLHQVNLTGAKSFSNGVSANVNLVLGDDAEILNSDDSGQFDLTQAYLSKTHGNFTVIGGKFVTLAGMEVINPAGNINASRSFLFFNQPLVHEGVRGSYKVNDMLSLSLGLNNKQNAGSNSDEDNTDLTLEAQIALTPVKEMSVYLTGYTGNEDPEPSLGERDADIRRDTVDLVFNYNLNDMVYLGLNADYINMEDGAGGHDELMGVAAYAQVKPVPKWRVAGRTEYLSLDAGPTQGDAYLRSNTLTLGHACTDNFEVMVEGRHDRASGQGGGFKPFANINGGFDGGEGIGFVFPNDEDQYSATIKGILKF